MISILNKEIIVINSQGKIWYLKHRPKNISEYIFQSIEQKNAILSYLDSGVIQHLLFAGGPGSGKTTLVKLLIQELNIDESDVLYINASEDNSIEMIRDKVMFFVSSEAFGKYKIVHLEEAERISLAGQDALKAIMEDFADNARFILTTNMEHKITPAIKSRCTRFHFAGVDRDDLTLYIARILIEEDINSDLEVLDSYVNAFYPDVRKIINALQQNSSTGTLKILEKDSSELNNSVYSSILSFIDSNKWNDARSIMCSSISNDEWEEFYRFLYENINKCSKFHDQSKWEEAIVTIADHLYKDSICADREINAAAMMIKLSQI